MRFFLQFEKSNSAFELFARCRKILNQHSSLHFSKVSASVDTKYIASTEEAKPQGTGELTRTGILAMGIDRGNICHYL